MDSYPKPLQYPNHDFFLLPLPSGRNQSLTEENPMNHSKRISPCQALALIALLWGAMVATLPIPAFAQQDVDPTWYDPNPIPHAVPNQAVLHPAALHPQQPAVTSVSTAQRAAKLRTKRSTPPKIADLSAPENRNPEATVAATR
jgi:hypothetical protein